uniref:Uncharacterized protein n=1 Tax=Strongyloides venezuelensis TaxID=75913 RepID=A0A0K0FI22_STRVS
MKLLRLLLYIQLIFLTVPLLNCYKFICQYRLRFFSKRCYLLLSVTEESYKSIFLCTIPRDLKNALLKHTIFDRFQSVGLLTSSNLLISQRLSKEHLRCIAVAFGFKPKKLAGVWIVQSQTVLKNYSKKYLVDHYGRSIQNEYPEYSRRRLSLFNAFTKRRKYSLRKMSCPISCSR